MPASRDEPPFDDDFEPDEFDDDELAGRLPSDDESQFFSDPDEGLPPDQARSRRAMRGVPDFAEDETKVPPSPTRAVQDALIDRMNDVLEDEWEWSAASEIAYEALAIDPTYGRAANALLRCYLTHDILREMQEALRRRFNPWDEIPNER